MHYQYLSTATLGKIIPCPIGDRVSRLSCLFVCAAGHLECLELALLHLNFMAQWTISGSKHNDKMRPLCFYPNQLAPKNYLMQGFLSIFNKTCLEWTSAFETCHFVWATLEPWPAKDPEESCYPQWEVGICCWLRGKMDEMMWGSHLISFPF